MRFKIDENLPSEILDDLRSEGCDAESVVTQGLTGSQDVDLLEKVRHEERAFLTMDKGVADVRVYPPEVYFGIVLFRPPTTGRGAVLEFVRRHLADILQSHLKGHLLVVTERSSLSQNAALGFDKD